MLWLVIMGAKTQRLDAAAHRRRLVLAFENSGVTCAVAARLPGLATLCSACITRCRQLPMLAQVTRGLSANRKLESSILTLSSVLPLTRCNRRPGQTQGDKLKRAQEFQNGLLIGSRHSLKAVSRLIGFLPMPQNGISQSG